VSLVPIRFTLTAGGITGLVVAVRLAVWPLAPVTMAGAPTEHANASPPSAAVSSQVSAESVAFIVSRDPFRIGRRPALPAYDPLRLAEQLAPPPPRPVLVLVGVVNAAEPSAVVEGLPGVEGWRVMRVGDVVAGLRVAQIMPGRVVITGPDTTWVLQVREPWKN
jgi:hypothetical protein